MNSLIIPKKDKFDFKILNYPGKTYIVPEFNPNNLKLDQHQKSHIKHVKTHIEDSASEDESKKIYNDEIICKPQFSKPIEYTHFISIPLCSNEFKDKLFALQMEIQENCDTNINDFLQDVDRTHLTLCVLKLENVEKIKKTIEVLKSLEAKIKEILFDTKLEIKGLGYFGKNSFDNETKAKVLYAKIEQNKAFELIRKVADMIIKGFLKEKVINENELSHIKFLKSENIYEIEKMHISLLKSNDKPINLTKILKSYNSISLGQVHFDSLAFSLINEFSEDGYYRTLHKIKF